MPQTSYQSHKILTKEVQKLNTDDISKDQNKHEIINFMCLIHIFWCLNILGIEVKNLKQVFLFSVTMDVNHL